MDIKVLYVNSNGFQQEHSESADSIKMLSLKTANKELTDTKLGNLIDGVDANDEHIHDARYFRENEHINTSAGAGDAAKPVVLDAAGKLSNTFINVSGLNALLDHGTLTGLGDDDHAIYTKADGTRAFTGDQSMGGNKITNLANPVAGTDAVNLQTLQNYQEGLSPKAACRVGSVANVNLASAPASIDGITLVVNDRVLIKDQTLPEQNGIYIFNGAASAMTRSSDFNSLSPIDEINHAYTFVQAGATNAGKGFVQNEVVAVLDTDPINFIFFNAATSITASTGLIKVGNDIQLAPSSAGSGLAFAAGVLSVNVDDSSIEINADTLRVKADGIKDSMIDFGTGANQVSAIDLPIADVGGYTSQTEVEGALQELYGLIAANGVEYTVGVGGVTKAFPVYVSGNNTVSAYGALSGTQRVVGVAFTTELAAAQVKVLANDTVVTGAFAGFTAGQTVYWSGSALSSTIPSGGGSHVWKLGVAKNSTDMHVEIEFIKRNA